MSFSLPVVVALVEVLAAPAVSRLLWWGPTKDAAANVPPHRPGWGREDKVAPNRREPDIGDERPDERSPRAQPAARKAAAHLKPAFLLGVEPKVA